MNTENINIEDIKIGETYNVRVKVSRMNTAGVFCYACDKDGSYLGKHPNLFTEDEVEAFSPIILENGRKNSEPAPKHDPCRLFRDGDKVTPRLVNGRDFNSIAEEYRGMILTVTRDEEKYDNVYVECGGDEFTIDPAYLELVTPVEELGPFTCGVSIDGCIIYKNGDYYAEFVNSSDAEKACKLLNAEYRKENA